MRSRGIAEAQVFLTRACQLSCVGCQVVRGRQRGPQLLPGEWERAAGRMAALGVTDVKVLGGEPALAPDELHALVGALSRLGVRAALLTNGIALRGPDGGVSPAYSALPGLGLYAVFPSVDGRRGPFARKTQPGWDVLDWAAEAGIPARGANVTVTPSNLAEIGGVVEELVAAGVVVNLAAYNYLREGEKQRDFEFRMEVPAALRWREGSEEAFRAAVLGLLPHASSITGGEPYLRALAEHGWGQTWECGASHQLRVDADGLVMTCLDKAMARPLSVLDEWGWDEYLIRWSEERRAIGKCSCSWSSPMVAEKRAAAAAGARSAWEF